MTAAGLPCLQRPLHEQNWVLFCRVLDNFGDAGFCWRLALALKQLGVGQVVLVIDQIKVINDLRGSAAPLGLTVLPWHQLTDDAQALSRIESATPGNVFKVDVLIEAFACHIPLTVVDQLSDQTVWFSLDYLATEPWADEVHNKPAPLPSLRHTAAQRRRWFVPGFSKATGGLLHGHWRHINERQRRNWRTRLAGRPIQDDCFLVLAFGYPDAAWSEFESLCTGAKGLLPKGFKEVAFWRPKGIDYSQEELDEILQSCDLNFVRGEDSFVRAHWAAAGPWKVPFVWQPYRQAEDGHGHKLAGWLNQMLADPGLVSLRALHWAWNGLSPGAGEGRRVLALSRSLAQAWAALTQDFQAAKGRLHQACLRQAGQPALEEAFIQAAIKPLK